MKDRQLIRKAKLESLPEAHIIVLSVAKQEDAGMILSGDVLHVAEAGELTIKVIRVANALEFSTEEKSRVKRFWLRLLKWR